MRTKPLVSVIIPAYNSADQIGEAIRSVLLQTISDLEVIVVDDCSSDSTIESAQRSAAGDSRVKIIPLTTNTGPGGARNAGIEVAQGEWIALLDADDSYHPQRLERLTQKAIELKADLIADNLCIRTGQIKVPPYSAFPMRRMEQLKPISASAFVASDRPHHGLRAAGFMKPLTRRDFLLRKQLRYDERFRVGQDFELYVRCLLTGAALFYVPESFYNYQLRLDSQCRGKKFRNSRQFLDANDHLRSIAESMHDSATVYELTKRRDNLVNWLEYVDFVERMRARAWSSPVALLESVPSLTYTAGRLSAAVIRRLSGLQRFRS